MFYLFLFSLLFLDNTSRQGMMKMPTPIENSIRKQNIKFLHHRSQFSVEYFTFIKKLVTCNAPPITRNTVIEKLVNTNVKYRFL